MENQTQKKSALQEALEKQFEDLLNRVNERFVNAGDQVLGLSKWMQAQLQLMTRKVNKAEIAQQILDVSSTALLEILKEKGHITDDEFATKVQEIMKRKGLDAPKSNKG